MENIFNTVVIISFLSVGAVIACGVVIRLFKDTFGPVKTLDAVVLDKREYSQRVIRKAQELYTCRKYVVDFNCNGKKKSFYVAEISYKNYRKGQKGILKYKGSKLIDFS